jgi:hypothetical protein
MQLTIASHRIASQYVPHERARNDRRARDTRPSPRDKFSGVVYKGCLYYFGGWGGRAGVHTAHFDVCLHKSGASIRRSRLTCVNILRAACAGRGGALWMEQRAVALRPRRHHMVVCAVLRTRPVPARRTHHDPGVPGRPSQQ